MKSFKGPALIVMTGMVIQSVGFAQELGPRGAFGDEKRPVQAADQWRRARMQPRGMNRESILFRMLMDEGFVGQIGLTPDKAAGLRDGMRKVQETETGLQEELNKLLLRQADVMAGLMNDREKKDDEAMKLVYEIGALRTEIAKLAIARILILREFMSDDQIAKARDAMRERFERMRQSRERGNRPARRPPRPAKDRED